MTRAVRRGGWSAMILAAACAGACAGGARSEAESVVRDEAAKPAVNPDAGKYLFEDTIKPGQKGYGLTCMRGGKIERFEIEVIDVMKNITPGNNAILVRCSGLGLEHSGIIAGMSGSPVYIDNKMIGAVAFGWALGKDPIAGVQPIRQMLAIPVAAKGERAEGGGAAGATSRWRGTTGLAGAAAKLPGYQLLTANLARRGPAERAGARWGSENAKGLRPLASPLMVSGASERALSFLSAALRETSLVPIASGTTGGAGAALGGVADVKAGGIKLEPGSSIAIPLVTGDMDLSALGTVTEVTGGRVYAFGHAMLADGVTSLPIATGYVYTIMPNLQQSFKMGASFETQGTLVTDEQNGIVGILGEKPRTIAIRLHVTSADGSVNRTYKYQLAPHPKLSPEILGAVVTETLTAQRALPKQFTAKITTDVAFDGARLQFETQGTSGKFNVGETLLPIAILGDNPFRNLKLEGIDMEATIEAVNRDTSIKSVNVRELTVAPGAEVTATVELEPFHQTARKVQVQLTVPTDTPDGEYELCVGGAEMVLAQEQENFPHRFAPENIEGLVGAVKNIVGYRQDRVYARLVLDIAGAAQRGQELTHLPASRVALFASEKLTNTSPVRNAVMTSVEAGGVVEGGQTVTISVDKNAGKRFYSSKRDAFGGGASPPAKGHRLPKAMNGPSTIGGPDEDPFK